MRRRREELGLAGLKEALRALLPELSQRYSVRTLAVFGSRARETAHSGSDVDLLIEFNDANLSFLRVVELEQRLTDALGAPVDLVERQCLRPNLAARVLQEAVPI
jgi:predicted nucleotidyltransferase